MLCQGSTKDGSPCEREGQRSTGFCTQHADQASRSAKSELSAADRKKKAEQEAELQRREEMRKQYLLSIASVEEKILGINDLATLREAGQSIILALVREEIDPKAAPSISQLLKQQMELLEKTKPKGDNLDAQGKQAVLKISAELTGGQAWMLMQNFGLNFDRMKKDAQKQTITVDAEDVKQLTMEESRERESQRDTAGGIGSSESTSQNSTEIF